MSRNKTRVIHIIIIYFRSTAVKIKYDLIFFIRRELVYNAITIIFRNEKSAAGLHITLVVETVEFRTVLSSVRSMILTVDVYLGGLAGVPPIIMCPS